MESQAPESVTEETPQAPPTATTGALAILALGLVAGLLGWGGAEAFHDFFRPVTRQATSMGGGTTAVADGMAVGRASTKNAVLTLGLAGAALGLCLGLAGGRHLGPSREALRGGAAGLAIGFLLGAGAAQALVPMFWAFWYGPKDGSFDPDGMIYPFLINAGISAVLGAAGGLAFGIGARREPRSWPRTLLAGLVGGIVGALIFEVAAAFAFPTIRMIHPIPPSTPSRLLERLLVALGVALAVAFSALPGRRALPAALPESPAA